MTTEQLKNDYAFSYIKKKTPNQVYPCLDNVEKILKNLNYEVVDFRPPMENEKFIEPLALSPTEVFAITATADYSQELPRFIVTKRIDWAKVKREVRVEDIYPDGIHINGNCGDEWYITDFRFTKPEDYYLSPIDNFVYQTGNMGAKLRLIVKKRKGK